MKRRLIAGGVLLGLLTLAGATYAPPLTLAQQAVKAEVIVRATVGTPATVQESAQSWTVYPLTVLETLAGDAAALPKYQDKPSVWVLSGLTDGPMLKSGEAMLLLYKARTDSPLVGFTQGQYSVDGAAERKVVSGLPDGTPGVVKTPPPAITPSAGASAAVTPSTASTNTATTTPSAGASTPSAGSTTTPSAGATTTPSAAATITPSAAATAPAVGTPALTPSSAASGAGSTPSSATPSSATPSSAVTPSAAGSGPALGESATVSAPATTPSAAVTTTPSSAITPSSAAVTTPSAATTPSSASTPPVSPSAVASTPPAPATLGPGQLTLDAFRQAVLAARAKAGK